MTSAPKRRKLLSSSRPPFARPAATLSAKATRAFIRSHHQQRKQVRHASGTDSSARARLDGELADYQRASIQGQSRVRGGDTSRVLVEWLDSAGRHAETGELRLLEVGALCVDNACARSGRFMVERIDLRSQHPDIRKQDFMQRPAPATEAELERDGFDVVSLSLVLNFVEDGAARGEMLRRVGRFLRRGGELGDNGTGLYPGLFLVLPAPCVTNSRYLDEEQLEVMMRALGYSRRFVKVSAKLAYYYFTYERPAVASPEKFLKKVLRPGGAKNNFAIVLQ